MDTVNKYPFLAPFVTVIEEPDRNANGIYTIGTRQVHVFPFEIEDDGQLDVEIRQLGRGGQETFDQSFRQSLSIRAWLSKTPYGAEVFYRFHPGVGGMTHLFYDKDLTPTPVPEMQPPKANHFSEIPSQYKEILIPLIPGVYYYNVENLEGSPANDLDTTLNSYFISFRGPNPICPPPYPEYP